MATADASQGGTSAVTRGNSVDFPESARAAALLDIVDEFDANLGAAGDKPASQRMSAFYLKDLRDDVSASLAHKREPRFFSMRRVAADLNQILQADSQPVGQSTAHAQARRRFDIWSTLGRSVDEILDYSAIVKEVCQGVGISAEAASIDYRLDVLEREIGLRRDEVLRKAQPEISSLAQAVAAHTGYVLAGVEATRTSAKTPAPVVQSVSSTEEPAGQAISAALEADLLQSLAGARQVIHRVVEREARTTLSRQAKDLKRTQLRLASTEGLAQIVDPRLEVSTVAADRLAALLRRMRGGSVGIAGPRGVGKSTIIRRFCDGRESIGDRPLLSVTVSAPVAYDSRDFMLHLFAETCRQAGAQPAPADSPGLGEEDGRDVTGVAVRTVLALLPLLAAWGILYGAATLVTAIVTAFDPFFVWGAALVLAASTTGVVPRRTYATQLGVVVAPLLLSVLGSALVVAGFVGGRWSDVVPSTVALTGMGAFAWLVANSVTAQLYRRPSDDTRFESSGPSWPPNGTIERVASVRLEEMRFQQTVKSGVSGKLSVPLGIEFGASTERSFARHPMTFPEVADSFARFLGLLAEERDVLIAIDELDKLDSDDETATRFLNDLKATFGTSDTYFLVSVSEDAMSRFERRGLPFRDVFDSTFDEILRVPPLSLPEARRLLAARLVGLPHIYAGLCYVLSGGVPRDLVRTARRVVEANERLDGGDKDKLEAIVRHLLADELESKTLAVEQAALVMHPPAADLGTFLNWIDDFRSAVAGGVRTLLAVDRAVDFQAANTMATDAHAAKGALSALACELATYGYFAATVLSFFKDSLTPDQIERAVLGKGSISPDLELLAQARMSFSVDAGTARKVIDRFQARPMA